MTNTKIDWPWPPGTRVQRIKENHNNCIVGDIYTVKRHVCDDNPLLSKVYLMEEPNTDYSYIADYFKIVPLKLSFPKNLSPEYKELFT